MSESPYTAEFRAEVCQEYLNGEGSYKVLSDKYGISTRAIRSWVAKYRLYGIAAFAPKSGNAAYTSEFKTMCVEAVLSGEGSVDDIVANYNISAREVLRSWIKRSNANRELPDYIPRREIYMANARRKTTKKIRAAKNDFSFFHSPFSLEQGKKFKSTAAGEKGTRL